MRETARSSSSLAIYQAGSFEDKVIGLTQLIKAFADPGNAGYMVTN